MSEQTLGPDQVERWTLAAGRSTSQSEPVPQQIKDAASGLGAAVSTGQYIKERPREEAISASITGGVLGVIGIIILGMGGSAGWILFFLGFAAVSFVYALMKFFESDRQPVLWFCRFERGFVYLADTEPAVVFRWDDTIVLRSITRIHTQYSSVCDTSYYYQVWSGNQSLALRDRKRGTRTSDSWAGRIGEVIEEEVTRAQLPRAAAAIGAGQALTFGDVSIDAHGITGKRGTLPWCQVEKVWVYRGYVGVKKAGKWLDWSNQPVSRIPNVFVFLALAQTLHANAQAR